MSVAFIPYGQPRKHFCDLGRISMDAVQWLTGDRPQGTYLSELNPNDHVIVVAGWHALSSRQTTLNCPVSVLLSEPPAIKRSLYYSIRLNARKFRYVICHNTHMLKVLPNGCFVAHGGYLIGNPEQPETPKTKRISIIASRKKSATGHRLRHRLIRWAARHAPDLEAMGGGYRHLAEKAEGHNPFYFSVVIENSREAGYFTEKLIDCFLCRCIPVYWGAPDVEHFFDRRGMVICSTTDQIRQAVNSLTSRDYERMKPYLLANRQKALNFLDLFERSAQRIQELDALEYAA